MYQLIVIGIAFMNVVAIPITKHIYGKIAESENKAELAVMSLQQYQLHVAENYVNHEHLDRQMATVNKSLDEIKQMIAELRKAA